MNLILLVKETGIYIVIEISLKFSNDCMQINLNDLQNVCFTVLLNLLRYCYIFMFEANKKL